MPCDTHRGRASGKETGEYTASLSTSTDVTRFTTLAKCWPSIAAKHHITVLRDRVLRTRRDTKQPREALTTHRRPQTHHAPWTTVHQVPCVPCSCTLCTHKPLASAFRSTRAHTHCEVKARTGVPQNCTPSPAVEPSAPPWYGSVYTGPVYHGCSTAFAPE